MSRRALSFLVVGSLAGCNAFEGLHYDPRDAGSGTADGPSAAYADVVLADRPAAYWRFEETSGPVKDATSGGHDCSALDGPTRGVASPFGTAIDFRPATRARVSCSDTFDFAGTSAFTLEGWVRPRTLDDQYRKIFSKEIPQGTRRGYNVAVHAPQSLKFERWSEGRICEVALDLPARDQWVYVAATFSGDAVRLVVGDVESTHDCTLPLSDTSEPLVFGHQADEGDYGHFDGSVDELAIYDRALSPAEIDRHRSAGKAR